jgi:Holliday junction resolvase RusA-like endonuclease
MDFVTFIPCEPTAKARPRFRLGGGNVYTPQSTTNAERDIRDFVIKKLIDEGITKTSNVVLTRAKSLLITPLFNEEPISLKMTFFLKRPKTVRRKFPTARPDLDNYVKLVLDALNHVLWLDDSQVCEMGIRKMYCSDAVITPGIAVTAKILC